jgi:hypothetical protein
LSDAALRGVRADVALVGLAGRTATPDYLGRLLSVLTPSFVIPCHHDAFFAPLEHGCRLLPGIDLDGFLADTRALLPDARIALPDYLETVPIDNR